MESPSSPGRDASRIRATVLFADIVGFSALSARVGSEAAYEHATACTRLLDGIARRHGGSVDRYLGDALMAIFGHPVPQADSAARALAAALEMRRAVQDYEREAAAPVPLGLCVGVNTGEMVAGDIRGPVIREFHVLGDAVNVAARLKSKAPVGEIYVGPASCAEAAGAFRFRAEGALRLKGKEQPLPVHALLSRVRGVRREGEARGASALVGRDRESAAVTGQLRELAAGRGGVLLFAGEAGAGKSRLLASAAREAVELGVDLLELTASRDAAGEHAALFAPLLRQDAASRRLEALERVLRARAGAGPLLLLLDDLEQADAADAELLRGAAALAAELPLAVVGALRTGSGGPASGVADELTRRGAARLAHLEPLAEAEARELLRSLLGSAPEAGDETLELALRRAAGNPRRLALSAFLGGALRSESERERGGDERSEEAERRRATVLFADLTGFTAMSEKLAPEEAYPIVADCLALLDGIARKHGGTVDKYLGDCVLALFGVPKAIEEAPRAAVNAAIEMVEAVRRFSRDRQLVQPLEVHVGLGTGLGIAGEIGGALLHEYAVMGDPVVVASALTERASRGQIFVGPETQRETRDHFEYRPAEPLELKDRGEPVPAFELVSRRQQLHRSRPGSGRRVFSELVGREADLARLEEAVRALRAGRGAIASVVAEAGVGKSRLVAEAAARCGGEGIRFIQGRSLSNGQRLGYHPFADLLRTWTGIDDDDGEAAARQKLAELLDALLGAEAEEALPFVAALVGLPLEDAERERLDRIPGDSRERMTRALLARVLRQASLRAPLVVMLDDLHWADLSSLELLESLLGLAESHAILFLLVFRPGYAETSGRILALARSEHGSRLREIILEPLGTGAARELIRNLFGKADVPHATRQMIEAKARGNPFYIEEVVRSLIDAGALEYSDGGFLATARIHDVVIPGTVQEVIMARVDRLPRRRRHLLRVASVAGQSFHEAMLEPFESEPGSLAGDLHALLDAEFLVPSDRLQGREYAFKHPLIHEVTYDGIAEARRPELHRGVAEAIEARLPGDLPGLAGMLAFHFSMGREAERAEPYLFRAGEEAARVAAASEALHYFREASRLYLELHGEAGDPAKKALLEKKVGLALYHRGQLIEADRHFNGALRLLGERVPRNQLELGLRFGRNLVAVLAGLYLPRRASRPGASERDREVIDLMMRRAEAQTTASPARFVFDSMDTLARLDRVEPSSVKGAGGMYAGTVGLFAFGGLSFGVSRRFLARAAPLVDRGDPDELLFFRVMSFVHHFLEGDWSEEHAVEEALLEEGLRAGRLWPVSTFLDLDAMRQTYRGDYLRAGERVGRLRDLAERYGHELATSAAEADAAILHLERRELTEAVRAFELYHDEHAESAFRVSALSSRAEAELLAGDLPAARESLARAERTLRQAGRLLPFHASAFACSRYRHDLASLEAEGGLRWRRRARASRRAALAAAAKVAWRRPLALRLSGRHAWLLGRRPEALRAFARALGEAERLGAEPERARTHLELGVRLGERHPEMLGLAGLTAREHRALGLDALAKLGQGPERALREVA